jgi:hypothetical protein
MNSRYEKTGGKESMKKKIVMVSCLCVIVIALAGLTPALATKPLNPIIGTVPIEVTRYSGKNQLRTIATVSSADAWQIEQCLIDLNNAQQRNDRTTIAHCIAILNSKGITISAQEQSLLSPHRIIQSFGKTSFPNALVDNVTNQACLFTAIGQGALIGAFALKIIQAISDVIKNQTNPLGAIIVLIIFLPLLLLTILINDLIPIRIMMPVGTLVLANGTVSSIGVLGVKKMKVNATQIEVNVSWFTGLTINIPRLSNESKPFTFVSGFAAKVEGPLHP